MAFLSTVLVQKNLMQHIHVGLRHLIQASPAPVSNTGSNEPQFNQAQPCVVTNAPDANEVTAMVANTQKLIAA